MVRSHDVMVTLTHLAAAHSPAQFQAVEIKYATKALYICSNYYLPHYTPLSLLWEHLMSPYLFKAYIVHKLVFHPALFHEQK